MSKDHVESLRKEHIDLLEKTERSKDYSELLPAVRAFIERARKAGRLTSKVEDRYFLRAVLNFWASFVYEHAVDAAYPDVDLYPSEVPLEEAARERWIERPVVGWALLAALLLVVLGVAGGLGYKSHRDNLEATAVAAVQQAADSKMTRAVKVAQTAMADSDGDGLTDQEEERYGTDPRQADSDHDGLRDGEERGHNTDPRKRDTDGDGLSDSEEIAYGADPLAVDSDGDELSDGEEVHQRGTSPVNPDTDGDGLPDKVDPDPGKLPTLTPTPPRVATFTPSPTIPVAERDEILVIVAQFNNHNARRIDITEGILHRLEGGLQELQEAQRTTTRRVRVAKTSEAFSSSTGARRFGETYNATVVIWGSFDSTSITSRFEIIRGPERAQGSKGIISELVSFTLLVGLDQGQPVPVEMAYLESFAMGLIFYADGQYREAGSLFDIASSKVSEERTGSLGEKNVYFYGGVAYYSAQEYELAMDLLNVALEANRGWAEVYNNQGLVTAARGMHQEAIDDYYGKAIQLREDLAEAYYNRGLAYSALGQCERAINDYIDAIAEGLDVAEVYRDRGLAYFDCKWYEKAIEDYDQALALDPYCVAAYSGRGDAYYQKAKSDIGSDREDFLSQAIEDYTRVIESDRNRSEAYYKRAVSYKEAGKQTEAIRDLEVFVELVPDDPRAEQVNKLIADLAGSLASIGRLAFASDRDGNREIYVMDSHGFNQARLTEEEASDAYPAWSPDGNKVAFASDRDGNLEIYVMNSDGTQQIRLTDNEADDVFAAWSPGGGRIAFDSNRGGNFEIYVMNSDGSAQINLTNNPASERAPAWSPDGTHITFSSDRDGDYEIYVIGLDSLVCTQLTGNSDYDGDPTWSPNGRQIAFVSDRDGNFEIYVMNSDGTRPTRLTRDEGRDWYPAWSPDGKQIAFASDRDGNFEVYVMNSDGTQQIRLTDNEADDRSPAWSSSGTFEEGRSP